MEYASSTSSWDWEEEIKTDAALIVHQENPRTNQVDRGFMK